MRGLNQKELCAFEEQPEHSERGKGHMSRLSSDTLSSGEPLTLRALTELGTSFLYVLLGQRHLFMLSKCRSAFPCPSEAHFITQQVFIEHLLSARL